jgi:hypothetical protein
MACSSWGRDLAPLAQGRPVPERLVPALPALGQLGLAQLDPGRPGRLAAPAAEPASAAAAAEDDAVAAAVGTVAVVALRLATSWARLEFESRQSGLFARARRPQPALAEVLLAFRAPSAAVQGHQVLLEGTTRTLAAAVGALQPGPRSKIKQSSRSFVSLLFLNGQWFFNSLGHT